MSTIKDIFKEWSPRQLWSSTMIFLIAIMIVKLLIFDIIWCSATSFSCLSNPLVYINIILLTFILSAPMGLFHRKWLQVGILFAVDVWLVTSLIYNTNTLASIPLFNYLLMGELPESMKIISQYLGWSYLLFAITSIVAVFVSLRTKGRTPVPLWGKLQYFGYLLAWSILSFFVK